MYKLSVYIPESHLQQVKAALFAVGAGKIGDYDCCCWQSKGEGQFRPLQGSNPAIGQQLQLETVVEYKVEMVCEDHLTGDVLKNLRMAHPYEEPAFDFVKIADIS